MNLSFGKFFCLWGVSTAALYLLACEKQDGTGSDDQASGAAAGVKIKSIDKKPTLGGAVKRWRPYVKRDWQLKMDDADLVLHGISRKKFGNLDAFVKEFDRTYSDGETYREQFYDKFENYDDYNSQNAGKYHDTYLNNLKAWYAENKEKGEPAIALAGFEVYLAWYARGGGFARKVTQKGWEGFRKHNERAREILENAPDAAKKDPHFYSLWISIHLAQGGSLQEVQKTFEAGQGISPTYVDLYQRMTNYIQPKWYGENVDDWHKWLVTALKHPKLSDDDRLVLYSDVVRSNIRGTYDDADAASTTIYRIYGIDKERFMHGLAACCRRYPKSSDWPSAYLYHAVKANSESSIKEALELMDRKFTARIFGGEKEFFVTLSTIEENYPRLAPLVK